MTAFLHAATLAVRHDEAPSTEPGYAARDHARHLGITEADLVEMDEGTFSARLRPDWPAMLAAFRTLGPTVARTCNADAVLETTGIHPGLNGAALQDSGLPDIGASNTGVAGAGLPGVGLPDSGLRCTGRRDPGCRDTRCASDAAADRFVGNGIGLRLCLAHCAHAWAVRQGGRSSLQIFGRDGAAIHKVLLTAASNRAGWMQLIETFAAPDLPPPEITEPAEPAASPAHATDPTEAGRDRGTRLVEAGSFRNILAAVAESRLPIHVRVGNPGCVHARHGMVAELRPGATWIEAFDPRSRLLVRAGAIAEVWIGERRTDYGEVSVVEAFGPTGIGIATLSSRRGANLAEERRWRAILDALVPHDPGGRPRTASLMPA